MRWWQNAGMEAQRRRTEGLSDTGAGLERKYWVAMGLYAALALAAWFVIGEGTVRVNGRPVELRLIPLIVLGGFALRTWLARQADKIRRGADGGK